MSKKKRQPPKPVLQDVNTEAGSQQVPPLAFGVEDMLAELEAIVSEAETRLSREELET